MRKLIAVLMALMMVFGAVCAFAEEDGAAETGEEVQEVTASPEDDADVPEEEPEDEGEEEEDEDLPEDEAADEDETADEDEDEDGEETEEDEDLPEDETEEEDEEASEDEPEDDEEDAGESGQNGRGTGSKVKAPSLWKAAADPTVTEELQALFDKGLERLLGVDYVPLVFLGTWGEDEAGYAFLCQATVVVPDAEPEWSIVFLYEDEDGGVMLWDISDLDLDMYCDFSADA